MTSQEQNIFDSSDSEHYSSSVVITSMSDMLDFCSELLGTEVANAEDIDRIGLDIMGVTDPHIIASSRPENLLALGGEDWETQLISSFETASNLVGLSYGVQEGKISEAITSRLPLIPPAASRLLSSTFAEKRRKEILDKEDQDIFMDEAPAYVAKAYESVRNNPDRYRLYLAKTGAAIRIHIENTLARLSRTNDTISIPENPYVNLGIAIGMIDENVFVEATAMNAFLTGMIEAEESTIFHHSSAELEITKPEVLAFVNRINEYSRGCNKIALDAKEMFTEDDDSPLFLDIASGSTAKDKRYKSLESMKIVLDEFSEAYFDTPDLLETDDIEYIEATAFFYKKAVEIIQELGTKKNLQAQEIIKTASKIVVAASKRPVTASGSSSSVEEKKTFTPEFDAQTALIVGRIATADAKLAKKKSAEFPVIKTVTSELHKRLDGKLSRPARGIIAAAALDHMSEGTSNLDSLVSAYGATEAWKKDSNRVKANLAAVGEYTDKSIDTTAKLLTDLPGYFKELGEVLSSEQKRDTRLQVEESLKRGGISPLKIVEAVTAAWAQAQNLQPQND